MTPKFSPGHTVATPGALEALAASRQLPTDMLARHISGDWGDLCEEDKRLNDEALLDGSRILSSYTLRDGKTKLWIITESDRSSTCLLLPSEY